jgi:hypothetical protein
MNSQSSQPWMRPLPCTRLFAHRDTVRDSSPFLVHVSGRRSSRSIINILLLGQDAGASPPPQGRRLPLPRRHSVAPAGEVQMRSRIETKRSSRLLRNHHHRLLVPSLAAPAWGRRERAFSVWAEEGEESHMKCLPSMSNRDLIASSERNWPQANGGACCCNHPPRPPPLTFECGVGASAHRNGLH